jgi:hypothetical protein
VPKVATKRLKTWLPALAALIGLVALTREVGAFSVGIHEDITADALSFLRDGVLADLENEHGDWADADEAKDYKWVHADSCAFGETVQQVNEFYGNAVENLVPGPNFEPWSASDDFGRVFHPAQDFYSHSNWVELGFPVNDDPATVDVVEGLSTSDLVDFGTTFAGPSGLGPWGEPGPFGRMRGDILLNDAVLTPLANVDGEGALDVVDVNGDDEIDDDDATVVGTPAEWSERPAEWPQWNVGLLPHPTIPGNAGFVPGVDTDGDATFAEIETSGLPVRVMTSGENYRLLISGVGGRPVEDVFGNQCDPFRRDASGAVIVPHEANSCQPPFIIPPIREEDDYSCIAYHGSSFALTHDGSARSELNKDSPSEAPTRHPKARALATLQSRYEWCRFVHQAGAAGGDGVLLSLWVDESESANLEGTPCAPDDGRGPGGVTIAIDRVEVREDMDIDEDEPGEINLSLALYDSPFAFHRLVKSKSGPTFVDDDGSSRPNVVPAEDLPAPVTQCVGPDGAFRVALHGWDDDEGNDDGAEDEANGDYDQHGSFPGSANVDDALVGFSETLAVSDFPLGSARVRQTESSDLRVTYTVTRVADDDGDGLDACGESFHGTERDLPDTDFDLLNDGTEIRVGTNPLHSDTDGDFLFDGIDPDWLGDAIESLPIAAVKGGEGRRRAMLRLVDDAEARAQRGLISHAVRKLTSLRRRIDGCGAAPGRNDWIVDCTAQLEIRGLADLLIANLSRPM